VNILEKVEGAERLQNQYTSLKRKEEDQEAQALFERRLAYWVERAEETSTNLKHLDQEGLLRPDDAPTISLLVEHAAGLLEQWSKDKEHQGDDFAFLGKELRDMLSKVDNFALGNWKKFCRKALGESDFLEGMLELDKFKQEQKMIKGFRSEIERAKEAIPDDAKKLKKLLNEKDKVGKLMEKIDFDGYPNNVKKFIRTALASGAELKLLKDQEILRYLTKKDLVDSFIVKPRSSSS